MNYNVIICDAPWQFSDSLRAMKRPVKRSAQSQYATLTPSEICNVHLLDIVDPEWAVLALWVPGSMLQHGLRVMDAWGFTFKQTFVWVKLKKDYVEENDWNNATRVGMGRLFRQSHEIALIGTHGRDVYKHLENKAQRSVLFDLNLGHSVKPPGLHERLELMFPIGNKLELFARRLMPGWTCIGDAVTGKDVNESIQELGEL